MSAPLRLLAAALLFSTGGAAIKATTLTAWQVASFRSGTAGAAILLLVPEARRHWTWRAPLVGLSYAAVLVCFVLATKLTTAANAIFLQATAPLYLMLFGPWLLGERIRRAEAALLGAVALGMALFFLADQAPVGTAPDPARGNLLAAGAGLFWALTITGLRSMPGHSITAVACGNLIAFLGTLPAALPVGRAGPADWLVIGYLGVFQIGLAYRLLTTAVEQVPALEASLLLMLEPALNPVWAWILHGERPGGTAIAGGALILGATFGRALAGEARR